MKVGGVDGPPKSNPLCTLLLDPNGDEDVSGICGCTSKADASNEGNMNIAKKEKKISSGKIFFVICRYIQGRIKPLGR